MKLLKNQLEVDAFPLKDMMSTIWNVIWPFEHFIFKRFLNIYLIQKFKFLACCQMVADWRLYEASMFNLLQNALKYNKTNYGDVVITQTCKPVKAHQKLTSEDNEYILET